MNDPYQVLGVSRNASTEEIKEAYKQLAKKYHPDNYAASPLEEVANEKMKEINEAYDTIMNERKGAGGTSYQANSQGGYQQNAYQGNSSFPDIRRLIQQNRFVEAEELLDGVPVQRRDAEWYFLKGSVYYSRGWLDDAMNHFSSAYRMNPNNPEYRAAYQRMAWQRQGNFGSQNGQYRTPNQQMNSGCTPCDMCCGMMCADSCCECMGGDCIPCC